MAKLKLKFEDFCEIRQALVVENNHSVGAKFQRYLSWICGSLRSLGANDKSRLESAKEPTEVTYYLLNLELFLDLNRLFQKSFHYQTLLK